MKNLCLSSLLIILFSCTNRIAKLTGQEKESDLIRINQVGYYPEAPKIGILVSNQGPIDFRIIDVENNQVVFTGKSSPAVYRSDALEWSSFLDFSKLSRKGSYRVLVKGIGLSYPFSIKENIYRDALVAGMKSYYFQRSGLSIDAAYAGKWSRPAGHPDNEVILHKSTGKEGVIVSDRGWYDAGDYGKYVVNGAFSLGQLLQLYEEYPDILPDNSLNIPESGNDRSDLLDELKYEMDWLLAMQDDDGGVFFKLTTLTFSGMELPHLMTKPRYVIGKSTSATLDFAAVASKMSRAMRGIDDDYAQACLRAAENAWKWALIHPNISFKNPLDVKTGEYPDDDFSQEFFWAAAELYVTTRKEVYRSYLEPLPWLRFKENESWANFMDWLGAFTLLKNTDDDSLISELKRRITTSADLILDEIESGTYRQPIDEYHWGSNSDVLNACMILAQAYRIDTKKQYLVGIKESVDYIFGKNALGYSFLTGFGQVYPRNIHHRPSAGDDIAEPIPGFLSGGPNYGKHDGQVVNYEYPDVPMKCWKDDQRSYASNEVCLNWNAPLVYVLGFLESQR